MSLRLGCNSSYVKIMNIKYDTINRCVQGSTINIVLILVKACNPTFFLHNFQGTITGLLAGLAQLNCSELKLKTINYQHG